jgi:hypothetical protein
MNINSFGAARGVIVVLIRREVQRCWHFYKLQSALQPIFDRFMLISQMKI